MIEKCKILNNTDIYCTYHLQYRTQVNTSECLVQRLKKKLVIDEIKP